MEKVVKVISHMEQLPDRNQGPSAEKQKQHNLFLCLQMQALMLNYCTMKRRVIQLFQRCLTFLKFTAHFELYFSHGLWKEMTPGVSPSSKQNCKSPQECICKSAHHKVACLCVCQMGFIVFFVCFNEMFPLSTGCLSCSDLTDKCLSSSLKFSVLHPLQYCNTAQHKAYCAGRCAHYPQLYRKVAEKKRGQIP